MKRNLCGTLGTVTAVATLMMSVSPGYSAVEKPAAQISVVARGGIYTDLVADGKDLVALRSPTGEVNPYATPPRLVRIDPMSGKILARSSAIYLSNGETVVDSHLWVESTSTPLPPFRYELLELNPTTLRPTSQIALQGADVLISSPSGLLWLVEGCHLSRLDPDSGDILATVRIGGAYCNNTVSSVGGEYLVTASTLGVLTVMDGRTGKVVRHLYNLALRYGSSLLVADSYLWLASRSNTVPTPIYIYKLPNLRLVKMIAPPRGTRCASGVAFFDCPSWTEYDSGVIWGGGFLSSDDTIGCANPAKISVVATVSGVRGFLPDDVVTIGSRLYGIENTTHQELTDVVRFSAPPACVALLTHSESSRVAN